MAAITTAVLEEPILGNEVQPWANLEYWVLIGGQFEVKVQMNSLSIEESAEGTARCRFTVIDPSVPVVDGKTCEVFWRGAIVFGGIIRSLTIDADPSEAAFFYQVEVDGWDALLARRTITKTYTNVSAGSILLDAITFVGLNTDGITPGVVDNGATLGLVSADHVRVLDFLRDVALAGGGVAYVDPVKRIMFRPSTVDVSDVTVWNARAEAVSHLSDLDSYRNRQIVKVTGTGGATVTETRNDLVQQAIRIADEGGSGIYEEYQEVKHPTSNVVGELSILGQAVGFVQLRTYARNARRVTVTMRDPAPRIGQLTTLNLPGFDLNGSFIAMRKTWREQAGAFLFDIEFWESSFQQIALESLLKIVGAAKAAISITSNVFPNAQVFSTPGTTTWTVPAGVTAAQFTSQGGSAGGGGGAKAGSTIPNLGVVPYYANGGIGGNSGKAVTILAVTAGQVYDVTVGAGGVAGSTGLCTASACTANGTAGTTGSLSKVSLTGVDKARGDGGGAGTGGTATQFGAVTNGTNGAAGGGLGDAVSVGGGTVGGSKGSGNPFLQPGAGQNGFVEIRW